MNPLTTHIKFERTRTSALVAVTTVAILVYFWCSALNNVERTYLGFDGDLYTILFDQLFTWSDPGRSGGINPFQGMGSTFLPFNVWITPGYAVLRFIDGNVVSRTASSVIFTAELFLSIVLLARAYRLSITASTLR